MIDTKTKTAINEIGERLRLILIGFYGKITFNYFDGNYVSFKAEQTVKRDNLNEGVKK